MLSTPMPARQVMSGVIIPMLLEDDQWQVDLKPGWRFLN